jgi:hypothetical protein
MALITKQPLYVHAFTYTKSWSLDSRKTLTDNDSDADGLELRASEIGFPPAVQTLADVANTLLLPVVQTLADVANTLLLLVVLAVKYAGAVGHYS